MLPLLSPPLYLSRPTFLSRFLRSLILFSALVTLPRAGSGQLTTMGRDFYLTIPLSSLKCSKLHPFQEQYLLITSFYGTQLTVTYFDQSGQEVSFFYNLKNQHTMQILLDASLMKGDATGEIAEYKSCHITSDAPVTVQVHSEGPNDAAETLILPTTVLGKKYVVATLPSNPGTGASSLQYEPCPIDSASSYFTIIAVRDSSRVTITPNSTTLRNHTGVNSGAGASGIPHPFNITLNRGQIYIVKAPNNNSSFDQSGSVVTSDKPIAVFAGNENAFNGSASNSGTGGDQRNILFQQMIPVEYWQTNGYLGMPLVDSQPADPTDGSTGELYKTFTFDSIANAVQIMVDSEITTHQAISRYEIVRRDNVTHGASISSTNNHPLMVLQYDYKQANTTEPFPAPAMMNIVPKQNYLKRFLFGVADDNYQLSAHHYLNAIYRTAVAKSIMVSKNGLPFRPIDSVFQKFGTSANFPGYPEWTGMRYEITPGSYLVSGDSDMMIYNYGMLGTDPDFDHYNEADYYYEYSSPVGESFSVAGSETPRVTVTQNCATFSIHASDQNPVDLGLSDVTLLSDPNGIIKRRPSSNSGYVSTNLNAISSTLLPGDTSADINITVGDPTRNAEGWLEVQNKGGQETVVHLVYIAPKFSFSIDSLKFLNTQFGTDSCQYVTFRNSGSTGSPDITVQSLRLSSDTDGFAIGAHAQLPVTLRPSDSLLVQVCFTPVSTHPRLPITLNVGSNCVTYGLSVQGSVLYPVISASDYDFGNALTGDTLCHSVQLMNTGTAPLHITSYRFTDSNEFSIHDSVYFPMDISPGQKKQISICYHPFDSDLDSVTILWQSNSMPGPGTEKTYSFLKGQNISPALSWNEHYHSFGTLNNQTARFFLFDSGSGWIHVDSVQIIGPNKNDFSITANRLNEDPLNNFDLNPRDSIWVDVSFHPDMTPGIRHAQLIAYDQKHIRPFVILTGYIGVASIAMDRPASSAISISPNPVSGISMTVRFPLSFSPNSEVQMFDALGRTLFEAKSTNGEVIINTERFGSGTYYLRVKDNVRTASATFNILR